MRIKNNFGFTLIELVVVVAILGVMASGVLAILNPFTQIQKARDARIKSDLTQIQKALETYYQDHNSYPPDCIGSIYRILSGSTCIAWGKPWVPYMNTVPKDPTPTHTYIYFSTGGQTYYLYANLGRGTKDSQACTGTSGQCASPYGSGINMATACGQVPCNFGVSSPNISP